MKSRLSVTFKVMNQVEGSVGKPVHRCINKVHDSDRSSCAELMTDSLHLTQLKEEAWAELKWGSWDWGQGI